MSKFGSFEEAVEEAGLLLDWLDRPSAIMFPAGFESDSVRKCRLQDTGFKALADDPAGLVIRAGRNPDAYDSLRYAIALKLVLEQELPTEAREWLAELLLGRRERPTANPGRGSEFGKELTIYSVIHRLEENGLPAMRNDGSEGHSACDAVAEAMRKRSKKPASYSRIQAIWNKLKKMEVRPGYLTYEVR